ncbi:conserved hypothetical protein [Desulfosarcina cetonica]|uniref:Hsp20/alpha crystallin family protein n=1 Tax=Desulfosarcina cetonica TaxID=90730 RepID=UPI0006D14534|nr:Hsp20/alpha crystallin family protein [Desulfosarcina cetonica]VTR68447.1 conserved hypothetical protein [Desulfosarcina cetonica]
MAIIKWDPFGNIATLQDRINKLFEDSFPQQLADDGTFPPCAWTPHVDIYENETGFFIEVDLPGVRKEDVIIEVKNNVMTISGQREKDPAHESANYYRRERICGRFYRTFSLHAMIAPEDIKAKFKNGVLTIEIPRPQPDPTRQISVDIE